MRWLLLIRHPLTPRYHSVLPIWIRKLLNPFMRKHGDAPSDP